MAAKARRAATATVKRGASGKPRRRTPAPYAGAIKALDAADENVTLEIDGEAVLLKRLEKILWPADARLQLPAYTRRDYVRHLLHVGPYMLPHLQNRPLTLIRMPDGITGRRFVHFHYEQRLPAFVETVDIFSEKNARAEEFLLCNNMQTVLWLAHIGTLELHVWHSRLDPLPDAKGASTDFASSGANLQRSILNYPDYLVFDIDPYIYSGAEDKGAQPEFNPPAFEKGKSVAFWLKAMFDTLKLDAFVKTSGKTGLHVLVPIVRDLDYDGAREIAGVIARYLVREHPQDVSIEWDVTRRTGKVFMDYRMNQRVKTLNVPYSVRGVPGAPVSMPLAWQELENAQPLDFTMDNVPARLRSKGDIWAGLLASKQDLGEVLRQLG